MIKCLIFDCGNVLVSFNRMIACRQLAEFCPLSAEEIFQMSFEGDLLKRYEKNEVSSEQFFNLARHALGAKPELTFTKFKQIWNSIFSENKLIGNLIADKLPIKLADKIADLPINPHAYLGVGVKFLILSNTNEMHWEYMFQLPIIADNFADKNCVLSFRVGARKPEEKIYREALARSDCQPNEIIYIDDMSENIEGFTKFGINTINYNCQTDSIEKLEKEIKKFIF